MPTKNNHSGRIFFLDLGAGRILCANPDGSDLNVIVQGGQKHPDGIAADPERGHLYWTNMGNPVANDGSIYRSDLNGENVTVIVPPGGTFTPKQIQIELKSQKLYWCDREGMRVMRCNLDGSQVETLAETGHAEKDRRDQTRWCVGIAVDPEGGKIYWTQKGGDNAGEGRIFRAGIELPEGETPSARTDIELLYSNLPEPIDLDLDPGNGMLYWTDRGDPPRGNTVNRAPMDPSPDSHAESQILISHLMEGIGLALDLKGGRMFVTDLAGSVYSANLDGSNQKMLMAAQGNLTGITYVEGR
ncbi:MAG: 3-hydroxyacyl-CoA dehydrogenase [Bryobacteraceae bacterium]|jgi:DNA-binding beta-propeller fold protein YncE